MGLSNCYGNKRGPNSDTFVFAMFSLHVLLNLVSSNLWSIRTSDWIRISWQCIVVLIIKLCDRVKASYLVPCRWRSHPVLKHYWSPRCTGCKLAWNKDTKTIRKIFFSEANYNHTIFIMMQIIFYKSRTQNNLWLSECWNTQQTLSAHAGWMRMPQEVNRVLTVSSDLARMDILTGFTNWTRATS